MAYDKMTFEDVDNVFMALMAAFHPNGIEDDDGADRRMEALFDIFLEFAHWDSDEYWAAVDSMHECPKCAAENDEAPIEKKDTEVN